MINYETLRCTVCGATFDTLEDGNCPKCGTCDDYIVLNEKDDDDDDDDDDD